ncbi:MAG: autotransporter domain-containing protein, partial [Verrucomicrobiae bacterium]|nr:autotransporter domain-containing protein [Verrucomicrobiae bacterium]
MKRIQDTAGKTTLLCLAVCLVLLMGISRTEAQSLFWAPTNGVTTNTWSTGSTLWSTNLTVTNATSVWVPGNTAVFSAVTNSGTNYVQVGSNTVISGVNGMVFNAGYTELFSTGTAVIVMTSNLVTVTNATTVARSLVPLVANNGFVLNGGGIFFLNAPSNAIAGGMTISNGELVLNAFSLSVLGISGNITNLGTLTAGTANGSGTLTNNILGGGNFGVTGPNVVTLTGSNTFSSMLIGTNSSLIGNSSSLSGNAVLQTNSTLTFNQTTNGTFSGNLAGSGTLVKTGAATLVLNGFNIMSGNTLIQQGTLQGDTVSLNGGIISNNSSLVISQSFNGTLVGSIAGTGSLTKEGTGTVTLNNATNLTGGTVINNGVLALGAGSQDALLRSTVTLNVNNGLDLSANTSATLGNLAGAGNLNIAGVTLNVGSQGSNSTYTGVLSGAAGALNKQGGGILTLVGAQTYTGPTVVEQGSLAVDGSLASSSVFVTNGAVLRANGTISSDVTNQGTLSMVTASGGIGSLNLNNLVSSGAVNFVIGGDAAGQFSTINIVNDYVGGGPLSVSIINNYFVRSNVTFQVITAGNSVSGVNPNVVSQTLLADYTLTVGANDVTINATAVPFGRFAATANQRSLGAAMDRERAVSSGDMDTVMAGLFSITTPEELRAAYDAISPERVSAIPTLTLNSAYIQAANMQMRYQEIQGGARGMSANNLTLYDREGQPISISKAAMVASTEPTLSAVRPDVLRNSPDNPWGFFISGSGGFGSLKQNNTPTGNFPGYDFDQTSVTLGGDYKLSERLAVGLSAGYAGNNSRMNGGLGSVNSDSVKMGAYSAFNYEGYYLNGYFGGGYDFYKSDRAINFGSLTRTATGRTQGQQVNLDIQGGYDFKAGSVTFGPQAGFGYNKVFVDGFTESGADALNMKIGEQEADSLRSNLGGRVSVTFKSEKLTIRPYLGATWQHEFEDRSRSIDAQFTTGANSSFSVQTAESGRDAAVVDAGIVMNLSESMGFFIGSRSEVFRDNFQMYSFTGGFQ